MTQVSITQQQRIDYLLDYLSAAWRALPDVEREIDCWDIVDQIDYIEEWAPKEALWGELTSYALQDMLNELQRQHYTALQELIALYRPCLQRLRAG